MIFCRSPRRYVTVAGIIAGLASVVIGAIGFVAWVSFKWMGIGRNWLLMKCIFVGFY